MNPQALQALWARAFLDEMARCGVEHICVTPGSRSTPLVMGAASDGRFRTWVHIDERSAGFFALGLGKATRRPAAVITTSGTATANLLPAAIEAAQSGIPLLLLTADRPQSLRGADANQTIEQPGLYGGNVRESFEVGLPEKSGLRRIRALACRSVGASLSPDPGPVHVNFAFDKPLEPIDLTAEESTALRISDRLGMEGRDEGAPMVRIFSPDNRAPAETADHVSEWLKHGSRGVIVAGPVPDPERVGPALCRLATATGFPLLADPLSGARYGTHFNAHVVAAHDLILRDPEVRAALRPDLIVRVGSSPTSAAVLSFVEEAAEVPQVVVADGGRWNDHLWSGAEYIRADPAPFLDAVTDRMKNTIAPKEWRDRWARLDDVAQQAAVGTRGPFFEANVIASVVLAAPEGSTLFVSNSMPIRDLDAFGGEGSKNLRVYGNRGASGIDGILSTALGISAAGTGGRVIAVVGDLAFLHDSGGLLAAKKYDLDVVFVVIDNDGGGIFHMLPIRKHEPHFTPYFATPHGLDLGRVADLYGIRYRWSDGAVEFRTALDQALDSDGPSVVVVRTDRDVNQKRHEEMVQAVTGEVRPLALAGAEAPKGDC
jgi:2-succinyl-5-enolpyruvyl-6-hydroxy-3-cyclohexene-1-carboxylate synthase